MDQTLGTLVRQLRLQNGYSLRELARRIGLHGANPRSV